MKRTLAIGDIHGGLAALDQCLKRANVTPDDKLVFLGDYVDGWSQSPQVLDFLIELQKTHECVLIRGNHDDLLMDWLQGKDNELWYHHGGESTVLAYSDLSQEKKQQHVAFLKSLESYHIDSDNRLFVHAGFTNMHGVEQEFYPRLLFWDRTLWEMALGLDKSIERDSAEYPKRLRCYNEIFIGHTPVTRIGKMIPVQMANVWNIDTGAAFKGPLTIIDVETKEFWQSDLLPELYPRERGRN